MVILYQMKLLKTKGINVKRNQLLISSYNNNKIEKLRLKQFSCKVTFLTRNLNENCKMSVVKARR